MRIAILVNPDAGLGGRLGFKGSDGRAKEARAAGASDRAGPRMNQCLAVMKCAGIELLALQGRMGGDWIEGDFLSLGDTPAQTSAYSTKEFIIGLPEVDLLLYAGGDGTTRDIIEALDGKELPMVGVPAGVKMHSGCFATTPKAAAEVVCAFVSGELLIGRTEVMDLDEEAYRSGEWKVRMYGETFTPSSPKWMQGAKEQVERESEIETIEAMSEHIGDLVEDNSDLMMIWGSGGTLKEMGNFLGYDLTLLGIDILHRGVVYSDLNEEQLLNIIEDHDGKKILLLSPMGGQGFLIGRGNLQLSPEVLRKIGIDDILGIATPAKLLGLNRLRIDSGDTELDNQFRERRFIKMLQGYRTTRVVRVAEE